MPNQILVVEDDEAIAELVEKHLQSAGYRTFRAMSGPAALSEIEANEFALIVLDLGLPGIGGLEVTRRVRVTHNTPILMLTAQAGEQDKVVGLETGADDYLTKPFSTQELVARVRAILRRTEPKTTDVVIESGDLRVDPGSREVQLAGKVLETTGLEFDLLYFLAGHPSKVFSREALMQQVWGDDRVVDERAVDNLISRLRRKLEVDPSDPRRLRTVWGAGYRYEKADA